MKNRKILLIDDSVTQLKSLSVLLSKEGYELILASNGVDGIQFAYAEKPDLIISDIVMPDIDGYQVCRFLKNDRVTQDIPIILLTNLKDRMDRFWGIRSGADAFINKFGDIKYLVREIEKLLHEKDFMIDPECNDLKKFDAFSVKDEIELRLKNILNQSLMESTVINEFRNLSEFISDTYELNKEIFSLISSLLDYNVAGLFFNERDEKKPKNLFLSFSDISLPDGVIDKITDEFFNGVLEVDELRDKDIYQSEVFETNSLNGLPVPIFDNNFASKLIIPITFEDKLIGGLCLFHVDAGKYSAATPATIRILDIIVKELKLLMKMKWLYSETKFLITTDSLTGLYNRRYFQQTLDREFERARRNKSTFCLLMMDIDYFKSLNDTYGHQFGDKVLVEVSKTIKESLRKTDYVARFGGEEFVAILPDTSMHKVVAPVERLRSKIEKNDIRYGDIQVKVTISIGVASMGDDVPTEADLIENADQALYQAKHNGKNRIEFFSVTV